MSAKKNTGRNTRRKSQSIQLAPETIRALEQSRAAWIAAAHAGVAGAQDMAARMGDDRARAGVLMATLLPIAEQLSNGDALTEEKKSLLDELWTVYTNRHGRMTEKQLRMRRLDWLLDLRDGLFPLVAQDMKEPAVSNLRRVVDALRDHASGARNAQGRRVSKYRLVKAWLKETARIDVDENRVKKDIAELEEARRRWRDLALRAARRG